MPLLKAFERVVGKTRGEGGIDADEAVMLIGLWNVWLPIVSEDEEVKVQRMFSAGAVGRNPSVVSINHGSALFCALVTTVVRPWKRVYDV